MNNWSERCSPTCSLSRFNFAVSKSFPQANVFHQAFSTDGTVSVLCGLANQDSGVPVLDENKFVCACWRPKRSAGVWMEVTLVSTQRLKSCLLRQHFVTCCVSMKENEHLTPSNSPQRSALHLTFSDFISVLIILCHLCKWNLSFLFHWWKFSSACRSSNRSSGRALVPS